MSIISNEERVKLFEILYPVASFDANFYPDLTEKALDEFKIPKNPQEQQKIADCLSSLDELIAAQARKIDVLKTHKKGLMQQLFPSAEAVAA